MTVRMAALPHCRLTAAVSADKGPPNSGTAQQPHWARHRTTTSRATTRRCSHVDAHD
jgi:hypothetical protein